MPVAIDLGTSCFRSLREIDGKLMARRCPAVYLAVDDAPAEHRLLDQAAIPYLSCDEGLIVVGEPALELAQIVKRPCIPLLPHGQLPQQDPLTRQVIAAVIETLLPPGSGTECATILPTACGTAAALLDQQMFFERLLRLRGYRPQVVSAGGAGILAGLGTSAFTGLSIAWGASGAMISIGHRGHIIGETTSALGGDWIDEHFARQSEQFLWDADGNQYLDRQSVAQWKKQAAPSILNPQNRNEGLLTDLYREMLRDTLTQGVKLCQKTPWAATLPKPLPLVCTGGPTRINGFPILLRHLLQAVRFPLEIAEIRTLGEDEFATARGSLIRVLINEPVAAAA